MIRKTFTLIGVLALLLSVFAFGSGSAHAASHLSNAHGTAIVPSVPPPGHPNACLGMYPSSSNVSRTSTTLSYNVYARVKNECTSVLLNDGSGGWIANFVVDCDGVMIGENPELSGGVPGLNVGASFTFLDGHYTSECVDQFGNQFAPSEVVVNLSASGNLQDGNIATGTTYITIS